MITVPSLASCSPLITSYSNASYFDKAVSDLYQQMKDNQGPTSPVRTLSSAASLTSISLDISPSSSNFFEVLYVGKIKVWNKKVPDTFIDDALDKFKAHEKEKRYRTIERLRSSDNLLRRSSVDSNSSDTGSIDSISYHAPMLRSSTVSSICIKSSELERILAKDEMKLDTSRYESTSPDRDVPLPSASLPIVITRSSESQENCDTSDESRNTDDNANDLQNVDATSNERDAEESKDAFVNLKDFREYRLPTTANDHNRTMVLQVGRVDLRLISPDRKLVLLHKQNRDISTCLQGLIHSSHFGFICREGSSINTYIGYVFKCESPSVTNETVGAIKQAYANAEAKLIKPALSSCEHCPMVWYHRLCLEIESLTDRKTQAAIFRKVSQLDEEEQNLILTKFRGAETDSLQEQNEFLMMLLRAHCEMKQGRHVHDTAENRSEFLNQYLGGSTIFMKAKRSLSTSFDNLLKRKASKDDFNPILRELNLPINSANRESSPSSTHSNSYMDASDRDSEGMRSRSSTVGSQGDLKEERSSQREMFSSESRSPERNGTEKNLKSPMIDIFLKVGNSPKSTHSEDSPKLDTGSWRQAIFKRVLTPSKPLTSLEGQKRTESELRELWKKSIHQAILLVRMEKENAKIRAKQEENAVRRIKLEYDEMGCSMQRDTMDVWDTITNKESRANMKSDNHLLLQAIKQGIPRSKRGELWQYLAELLCVKAAPPDTSQFPQYSVPYETLLKQLTSHQHAILIDLGRTFPSHSYYSSPLGQGQLALFNLLKAYSLLDPEVGYCQGLSFVAGVLLLHMEESRAFFLLRHIMFRRGLRKQYLPDMNGLQVKLYQLSRLLHDQLPELYRHFDLYEVAPTLYAAPWLLTLFASQFPLGFVTRVFDLLFLESPDVVLRVAMALLSHHKENLLACDSFEEIMNYLKNSLPAVDKTTLETIMKQVSASDVNRQLNEYLVEYQVLQEEMASVQPQVEALHKYEQQNKVLTEQNKALMAQLELALSNVQRLEKNRTLQQSAINRLEMQSRGLEVTISTLATFVNSLIERKRDVDIPDEVRRIIAQISFCERKKNDLQSQNNLMRMFNSSQEAGRCEKPMVKSLSTGKIVLPAQNVPRSNSLNVQNAKPRPLVNTISSPNFSAKMSQFFSNSHNQILQQKLHGGPPIIDVSYAENEPNKTHSDCTELIKRNFRLEEKSVSLPLSSDVHTEYDNKISPTGSVDSGVGTPSSPREQEPHPLSNCDVQFTYNGTRELRNIKSARNLGRNANIVSK